ncbi:aminotransferase class III-fold pyridoxal phosphate-dependent enzyme [Caloranaerobacter sp. TR13]|uniref:aminotransferase class III-fold pyridoxal phosphate-dependent enzyme n=1 Tax=Caloranaerobacter sp. TR13 TaxID=1302151 RepID=UPI00128BCF7E
MQTKAHKKTWRNNHYDIKPDIITLGKSLGNGYPISAVVISKEIANLVEMKNFGRDIGEFL